MRAPQRAERIQAVARRQPRGTIAIGRSAAPAVGSGGGAVEHQAARDAGMARGELEHHARALRHADQQRANYPERVEQRAQVVDVGRPATASPVDRPKPRRS